MAVQTAFGGEQSPPLVGPAGKNVQRPFRRGLRGRGEQGDEVTELRTREGWSLNLARKHRLAHPGAVVPQGGGHEHRGGETSQMIETWSDFSADPIHLMTDNTALRCEELAPGLSVARRIEVVERVEEPDEIARFAGVECRANDTGLLHALCHPRQVVPHRCGQVEKRAMSRAAPQVGANAPSRSTRGMAGGTLGREDARSGQWILGWAEKRLGRRRNYDAQE